METSKQKKGGKFYTNLFAHAQKQYKNISEINAAYMVDGRVYGIDYISVNGVFSIASNTAIAEKIIYFR